MNAARAKAIAVLLSNGKVLLADGGHGTAELYDSRSQKWTITGKMAGPDDAEDFGLLLHTGQILVIHSNGATEIYNPLTNAWAATPSAPMGYVTSATLLRTGNVLVTHSDGSAHIFNPQTKQWLQTGSMHMARSNHVAILLRNGNVLVAGGQGQYSPLSSAELYNPRTGKWSITGAMHTARFIRTATLLPDGKVLVAGGDVPCCTGVLASAELYDPKAGIWTITGHMITGRAYPTATLLRSGKVLVTGGYYVSCEETLCIHNALATAELYDPHTSKWTVTGRMATARYFQTATLLLNGTVLVAGGQSTQDTDYKSTVFSSAEVYTS